MFGITKERCERTPEMWEVASTFYNEQLPYHNFDHAMASLRASEDMIAVCEEKGIVVDKDIVYYALLFHDAGYDKDCHAKGFDSKEAYAADIARKTLTRYGVSKDVVARVADAIMSTKLDGDFETIEQQIVRMADVHTMAGSYEEFVETNKKLKEEHRFLTGETPSWQEWKRQVAKIVQLYCDQEMDLTRIYTDIMGVSIFRKKAKENLDKFLTDETLQ